jgi:hypothetical protein
VLSGQRQRALLEVRVVIAAAVDMDQVIALVVEALSHERWAALG